MKIKAKNAPQFVRHLKTISKLAGTDHPYPFDVWGKLRRIEVKLHRITTDECNGDIDPDKADEMCEKLLNEARTLLPNARTLFVNGDPRGYALKLKDYEAKQRGIYQDWGGYGIICPEF